MTGAVSWEALTWIVGIIIVAGGTVAGFLFWVYRVVQSVKNDAAVKIAVVDAKVTKADMDLTEYKLHAAEKFATKDGVTQAIDRMEAAVERLTSQVHDAVERLTSRLDRMLEKRE